VACTLVAELAEFFQFQTIGVGLFVFGDGVVSPFAVSTLEGNNLSHRVLRQTFFRYISLVDLSRIP
jgi:hypothetical protein